MRCLLEMGPATKGCSEILLYQGFSKSGTYSILYAPLPVEHGINYPG